VDGAAAIELAEGEDALLQAREVGADGEEIPSIGPIKLRLVGESETPRGKPLIYVDGVRVVGVGEGVLAELDPDDIERIEVIKGAAAAALFGEEAAAGVIQIFMKK
jgi:TonB-dependent SusC/RagA subfamily outer membrane receptor